MNATIKSIIIFGRSVKKFLTRAITGVTITPFSGTYDGNPHGLEITGAMPGDVITFSYDGGQTYEPTQRLYTQAGDSPEVLVRIVRASHLPLNITAGIIHIANGGLLAMDEIVTAPAVTVVYDKQDHPIIVIGSVPGMITEFSYNGGTSFVGAQTEHINVGSTNLVVRCSAPGFQTLEINTSITITAAAITGVTVADVTATYDGNVKKLTTVGTVASDEVCYSYDGGVTFGAHNVQNNLKNAGAYPVKIRITRANYNELLLDATITINPKVITVNCGSITHVFDNNAHPIDDEVTPTSDGLVSGHTIKNGPITGGGTAVGSYTFSMTAVTINDSVPEDMTANYSITIVPGSLEITEA